MLRMKYKCQSWLVIFSFLMLSSQISRADEALYLQQCAACHNVNGGGSEAAKAPSLAAMSELYLERQLRHFRDGVRGTHAKDSGGSTMRAMARSLTDKSITSLASYISQLPEVIVNTTREPTGFRGRGLYSGCSSCHGAKGEGYPELGAPKLYQQHAWYLRVQLQHFSQGVRGAHPDDERGQQMRAMAESIQSQADIDTLTKYITGLGVSP